MLSRRKWASTTASFVLVVVLLRALAGTAGACVGARALAMGGAFTGLADDASATYWNPAALPDLKAKQLTYMHVFNKDINYQDFAAYVTSLNDRSAAGVSYIAFQMLRAQEMYTSVSWDQTWWWLSYGAKVTEKTSLGANARFRSDDVRAVQGGVPLEVSAHTDVGFDLALYHHASETVTLGLLVQDVNRPEMRVSGGGETLFSDRWGRNYRPGVAVRVPDENVIVSAEVYDALDDGDLRALRVGIEKQFPEDRFALRAGRYAAGSASGLTLGAGTWHENWSVDLAFLGGDLDNTFVLSATFGGAARERPPSPPPSAAKTERPAGVPAAIISPKAGESVPAGAVVEVRVEAGPVDAITYVDFFVDGSLIGSGKKETPTSVLWPTGSARAGSHTLVAEVRFSDGRVVRTAPVQITVIRGK